MTKLRCTYLATSTKGCPEKICFCYVEDKDLDSFHKAGEEQHPSLILQKTEVLGKGK